MQRTQLGEMAHKPIREKANLGEPAPDIFGERIFGRVLQYKSVLLDRYEVRMNLLPEGAIYLVLNPTVWVWSSEENLVGPTSFFMFYMENGACCRFCATQRCTTEAWQMILGFCHRIQILATLDQTTVFHSSMAKQSATCTLKCPLPFRGIGIVGGAL